MFFFIGNCWLVCSWRVGCTLAVLGENAGLPRGVLSVLTGTGETIRSAMVSDERVRKIAFTGSIEEGKRLMALCSETVTKVSLELGANCPFIVFEDADIDLAVKDAVDARFRHSGQAAMCANRFFVHENVYDVLAIPRSLNIECKLAERSSRKKTPGDGHG